MSRPAIPLLALILAAGLASAPPPAGAAEGDVFPFPVHQTQLDNGLRVVVIPFDSPGVLAFYTVVRTGSREEVEAGHSGFAHFFEHMMFRGTKRFSADAYNDVLKRMGAESNAYTSDDQTVYHMVAPAAELATIFDLEADRFKNLDYDEEGFKTEALAVLGEYNKNVSSPFLPMHEKLRELAFDAHTYEHTTMGFLADVKAMPGYYEYSRRFFDRFYRPENAILLVVGDAQPEAVFALAKKHYADWKPGYKPAEIKAEPPQKERRSAHIEWPQEIRPQMMVGYHVPAFTTASTDTGALDLLAQLLFSETAPLYREVVIEKQWADALGGGAPDHRDPYLFTINARVKSPDLLPKVKAAIDEHIARLQRQPADPKLLDRARSHMRYAFALSLDSPDHVADTVARFLALTGDVGSINAIWEQYRKVTPADIQRLARQVFRPENETMITLAPKAAPAAAQGGSR